MALLKVHGHYSSRIKGQNGLQTAQVKAKLLQISERLEQWHPADGDAAAHAPPQAQLSEDYVPEDGAGLGGGATDEDCLADEALEAADSDAEDCDGSPVGAALHAPVHANAGAPHGGGLAATATAPKRKAQPKGKGAVPATLSAKPTHFPKAMVRNVMDCVDHTIGATQIIVLVIVGACGACCSSRHLL